MEQWRADEGKVFRIYFYWFIEEYSLFNYIAPYEKIIPVHSCNKNDDNFTYESTTK